jgi:hypothetical protein
LVNRNVLLLPLQVVPASSCQPGDAVAEPMLLLSSTDSLPAFLAAAAATNQQPNLVDLAAFLCSSSSSSAMHGIDLGPPCRLRMVSLMWLEYADSLLYKQYKTLDPCLHEERAAVANSGGKAGSGALAAAGSSKSGAAHAGSARAKGLAASSVRSGQLMSSQLAAAVVAKQVDSEALAEQLFFERTGAVNTAGGAYHMLHSLHVAMSCCAASVCRLAVAATDSHASPCSSILQSHFAMNC